MKLSNHIAKAFATAFLASLFAGLCAAPSQQYSASGVVLEVDESHRSLRVSCKEIPGYMAAMVMDFPVRESKVLNGLLPGALIDFVLVVDGDSAYADSIRIHQFQSTEQEPMAARQLNLVSRLVDPESSRGTVAVGQRVPDFSLVSHQREAIKLSQFSGKVVAITFLYTHCPLPNYCYRLSNNFSVAEKRFAERMRRELILLSITFDPEHDQPETLAEYARKNWKADNIPGWYFLTGPLPEIQKVSLEFGMNFWPDEGLITHALHTAVLDRKGQLVANLEGNEFSAQQFGDLLESVLRKP